MHITKKMVEAGARELDFELNLDATPPREIAADVFRAMLAAAPTDQDQRDAIKPLIDAATWIVRLFGTHDIDGRRELEQEVRNLRRALPMWREINPWYESPKIGE